jgi:hypothetical protein
MGRAVLARGTISVLPFGSARATGDPTRVPVGIYVAQDLGAPGLWEAIKPWLAPAEYFPMTSVRSYHTAIDRDEDAIDVVRQVGCQKFNDLGAVFDGADPA